MFGVRVSLSGFKWARCRCIGVGADPAENAPPDGGATSTLLICLYTLLFPSPTQRISENRTQAMRAQLRQDAEAMIADALAHQAEHRTIS